MQVMFFSTLNTSIIINDFFTFLLRTRNHIYKKSSAIFFGSSYLLILLYYTLSSALYSTLLSSLQGKSKFPQFKGRHRRPWTDITVLYTSTVPCTTLQYTSVQCNALQNQYSTVQCSIIEFISVTQYNLVQPIELQYLRVVMRNYSIQ